MATAVRLQLNLGRLGLLESAYLIRLRILASLDTQVLMNLRKQAYAYGGAVCYPDKYSGLEFKIKDIKVILNTREHIMNKKESKEFRRNKAKQRHGKSKSRNR